MAKKPVNVKDFLRDAQVEVDHSSLAEKYGLSPQALQGLLGLLRHIGYLPQEIDEAGSRGPSVDSQEVPSPPSDESRHTAAHETSHVEDSVETLAQVSSQGGPETCSEESPRQPYREVNNAVRGSHATLIVLGSVTGLLLLLIVLAVYWLRSHSSPVGPAPAVEFKQQDLQRSTQRDEQKRMHEREERLLDASRQGDVDTVRNLIGDGALIDIKDSAGKTALMLAIRSGSRQVAELLLEKGADINAQDSEGYCVLDIASQNRQRKLFSALIGKGADAGRIRDKDAVLIWAVEYLNDADIKALIDAGANAEASNEAGKSALILLCEQGRHQMLEYALDRQKTVSRGSLVDLMILAAQRGNDIIVKMLIERGLGPDCEDRNGLTPLQHAVFNNRLNVAILLLRNGANVKRPGPRQATLLEEAYNQENLEMMDVLLEHGKKLDQAKKNELLIRAVVTNRYREVELLLNYGADPDFSGQAGNTGLFYAVERGSDAITELLLKHGAYLWKENQERKFPIGFACTKIPEAINEQVLRKLLEKEDELVSSGNARNRLIVEAARSGCIKTVERLLQLGVDVDTRDGKGQTALMVASQGSRKSLVQLLLDRNADRSAVDNTNRTALTFAQEAKAQEIVQLLRPHSAATKAKKAPETVSRGRPRNR